MMKHSVGSLACLNFTLESLEKQEHNPQILTGLFLSFLHPANVDSLTFAYIQKVTISFTEYVTTASETKIGLQFCQLQERSSCELN